MARTRTYRDYLAAIGRPPLRHPDRLRTQKLPGTIEIYRDRHGWQEHRFEEDLLS